MICFSCSWSFAHLKFSWYSLARLKDHTGTTMPTRVKMRWYHFKSNTLSGEIYLFSPYMDSVGSRGGAREVRSPLSFLHQTEARRAEKKIFGDWVLPLSKNMVAPPPPPRPVWRSGSATDWSTPRAHYPLQESCKKQKYLILWLVDYITSFIIYRVQN